jgi:hypothetical protein
VGIEVERYPDLGMSKPLTGDFRMDSRGEQMRGVGMAKVMEPDAGQAQARDQADPFMRYASRLDRAAIGLSDDESITIGRGAEFIRVARICPNDGLSKFKARQIPLRHPSA